ncbi:MAG: glycosyltransferase family 2 protein [Bernardetiaceae bacterium]
MKHPTISIVTPSFNQGQYITQTLDSVLIQGYPACEHIVMDGGSQDATPEILSAYGEQLHYWESVPDQGQSHAINKGFARSTGSILTWLNSDDQLLPGTLDAVAEAFRQNPELDLLYGDCVLFTESGKERVSRPEQPAEALLGGMIFAQPASFFSRRMYERFGPLSQDLHFAMDYDFFLPIAQEGQTTYLDRPLARYLYHTESKSVTHNAGFAREYAQVLGKLLLSSGEAGARWYARLCRDGVLRPVTETARYAFTSSPTEAQLRQAILYNLVSQAKYYYAATDLRAAYRLLSWIKAEDVHFFRQYPQLPSTYWRSRWVPAPLMRRWRRERF